MNQTLKTLNSVKVVINGSTRQTVNIALIVKQGLNQLMNNFLEWLDKTSPITCASCNKITQKKNSHLVTTLTGVTVRICQDCNTEYFGVPSDKSNHNL